MGNQHFVINMILSIINGSLTSGIIPENWKDAMTTPIYKIAKIKNVKNSGRLRLRKLLKKW